MPSFINTNMSALNTMRQLNKTQETLSTAMERLSSGKRINSAKDDAAGLGIAASMLSQINGMNQAMRNAYDGVSMAQTAEGALSTSADMLQRMRTLAVQASNASNSPADTQALQAEINQLASGLNDIASKSSFNGQRLLNGTMATQQFQVGPNAGDTVSVGGTNFQTNAYGNNRLESEAVTPGTAVDAGRFTITGSAGSATVSTAAGASARDVADAINAQSDRTGVTATASTDVNLGNLQAGQSYSFELTSNNSSAVSVSFTVGDDGDLSSAVNAFNQQSAKTGVTAQADAVTGGLKLTNASGEVIGLQAAPGSALAEMRAYDASGNLSANAAQITDAGVTEAAGTVALNSANAFSVTESTPLGGIAVAGSSQLNTVADIDVSSFESAQNAIATIDSALAAISSEQAKYGAIQNRFTATIDNLVIGAENTTAAKSRIMDADYAQQVSDMSRSLLLQKMGVAMQAQANQSPQAVLSLLK
ncbi:flagellin [Oxalobacter sp. OttesenSCG-928-P03]|nr:flagellin [Oxalobacter sp. OttesenSCG-928-P03]